MIVIHKIKIDMQASAVPEVVNVVQLDNNTRVIQAALYSGNVPFEIGNNASVSLACFKPDRTKCWYDELPNGNPAASVEGNTVSITLAPEVLTVAGSVNAAIVIREGLTDQISTFSFWICVARNPAAGSIISNNYYKVSDLESLNSWMKDVLCCTPQEWTDEQQAQARQNIGAMKQPAESDSINFNSSELKNVSSIEFVHRNEDGAQTGGVFVYSDENKLDEYGELFSRLWVEASDADSVVIGGLRDGILDGDVATVGQVKKAAPYLLVVEETDEGKGVLVAGDWDTMVLELKKGRSIILAGPGILSSESDVSVSIYHLAVAYQEDGYAVFFHTDERTHSIAIVRYDGTVEFKYVYLLELDPTLSLSGNYAAPASVVGKKLGDIETALDSIIAIQESLLGGGAE